MYKRRMHICFSIDFVVVSLVYLICLMQFNDYLLITVLYLCIVLSTHLLIRIYYLSKDKKTSVDEKEMLYSILEDMNILIMVWSPDLSVLEINKSLSDKIGKKMFQYKDFNIFQSVLGIDKQDKDYDLNNSDFVCKNREAYAICENAKRIYIMWKTTKIDTHNKMPVYLSIGTDLTEFVGMKNELLKSKFRFQLAMELSEIGVVFKYLNSSCFYVSPNIMKLLGLNCEYILYNDFIELIHPYEKYLFTTYWESIEDCDYQDVCKEGENGKSIEFRLKCGDGYYRWFNFRFKATNIEDKSAIAVGGLIIDITENKEKDFLIEKMAYIDEVTQIYNRNRFLMLGEETYNCLTDIDLSYWLIILDVDMFHIINDTCGYVGGNDLLKEIAKTILKNIGNDDFCARIGGDNFAIMIRDKGNEMLPQMIISNIQKKISELSNHKYAYQTISVSSGYCRMPDDGKNFIEILEHAEFALTLGNNVRSNIIRYDINAHNIIIRKNQIEKDLVYAIKNREFKMYYQPKFDLKTNEVVGAEALIRWVKPDGTMISPTDFIPVAERSNLINDISDYVLEEVCKTNKYWQEKGLKKIRVSVNLTGSDFYQTDICKSISNTLLKTGLSAEWLEIELTESLALKDVNLAIKQMKDLQNMGICISMDDFGTGYSSLSYIRILPIGQLKLDRSFILNLESDELSRQIVTSVIDICKLKKIQIVAEGIETSEQAQILKNSGCDHAQGFFFGKPMPANLFEKFLRTHTYA